MSRETIGAVHERVHPPAGGSSPDKGPAPVDEFMDSWVCWREACEDLRDAYDRWRVAEVPEGELAFAGYRAALDREEEAALVHAAATDRLRATEP